MSAFVNTGPCDVVLPGVCQSVCASTRVDAWSYLVPVTHQPGGIAAAVAIAVVIAK